jgi:transcriptional regulator with XRE-family HTH domain
MVSNLHDILIKEGITQTEFAKKSSLAPATINKFANGKRTPTLKSANKILIALNNIPNLSKQYEISEIFPAIGNVSDVDFSDVKDDIVFFADNFSDFELIIDRGDAPDEKIADLLADFSILYRMLGGSGINFELTDVLTLKNAFCYE